VRRLVIVSEAVCPASTRDFAAISEYLETTLADMPTGRTMMGIVTNTTSVRRHEASNETYRPATSTMI